MSNFKVAELVLALGNLGLWRTVFPAVSSSFCALRNLAGTVLSAVSVSVIRT